MSSNLYIEEILSKHEFFNFWRWNMIEHIVQEKILDKHKTQELSSFY